MTVVLVGCDVVVSVSALGRGTWYGLSVARVRVIISVRCTYY